MVNSVTVIGGGYVGFPNAVMIASNGYKTSIYDVNQELVNNINNETYVLGDDIIDTRYKSALKKNLLDASTELLHSDIYIIAVPTPVDHQNNTADLTAVFSATEQISQVAKVGDLVILMSTCPVGTTEKLYQILHSNRPDLRLPALEGINQSTVLNVDFVFSPERILPGNTFIELTQNSRVVGGLTESSTNSAYQFLNDVYPDRVTKTSNSKHAEMSKLIENSYRDVQLAFVNQLEMNCDALNLNVHDVIEIANMHPRIELLNPGIGVGGHCIPIDPYFLLYHDKTTFTLLKEARRINDVKEEYTIRKILNLATEKDSDNIVLFGLTYKPDVDDFRESPALRIFHALQQQFKGGVFATDVFIAKLGMTSNLIDQQTALSKNGLAIELVNHKEYRDLSIPLIKV